MLSLLLLLSATSVWGQRPAGCFDKPNIGPCRAGIPSYHYNPSTQSCDCFLYGGCGPSRNTFQFAEDCVSTCKVISQVRATYSDCNRLLGPPSERKNFTTFDPRPAPPPPPPRPQHVPPPPPPQPEAESSYFSRFGLQALLDLISGLSRKEVIQADKALHQKLANDRLRLQSETERKFPLRPQATTHTHSSNPRPAINHQPVASRPAINHQPNPRPAISHQPVSSIRQPQAFQTQPNQNPAAPQPSRHLVSRNFEATSNRRPPTVHRLTPSQRLRAEVRSPARVHTGSVISSPSVGQPVTITS